VWFYFKMKLMMKKKFLLFVIMLAGITAYSQTPAVVVIDSIVVPSGSEYVIGDTVSFSFNLHNVGPFATVNPITIKYKLSEGLHFLSSMSSGLFSVSGDTVIGTYSSVMSVGAKHNFVITFNIQSSSCPATFVGGDNTDCGGDGFLTISGGSELSSGFLRWREWTNWGTGGAEDSENQRISLNFPVGQATPYSSCGTNTGYAPVADITYYYDDDHTTLNQSVISKTLSSSTRITWEWYGVMVPDESTQYTFCGSGIDDGWAAWISDDWNPYTPESINPSQMILAGEHYNFVSGDNISTGDFALVCGRPYFYRIVVSSRNKCNDAAAAGFSGIALRKSSASTCTQNWGGMMSAKINIPIKLDMNCPPVAGNDSINTNEDIVKTGNVLTNDDDPNSDNMYVTNFFVDTNNDSTVESFTPGSSAVISNIGTFTLQSSGAYTFTPVHDYHGFLPSITYISWDGPGNGGYDTAMVFMTVFEVPDAGNDAVTTDEDVSTPADLFVNDNDVPATSGTLTLLDQDNGTLVVDNNGTPGNLSDDSFTYVPGFDFAGMDTIYYIICNTYSNCDTGMFVATVNSVTDIVPDTVSLCENDTIKIDVLANDGFAGHHAISAVTLPAHGAVTVNSDTTFRYIPTTNHNGTDTFTYKVTIINGDGTTSTETALVNITVNPSYSLLETAIDTVIFCTAPYYYDGITDTAYQFDATETKVCRLYTDKGCDSIVKVVAYYNNAAQSGYNFTITAPADKDTLILFGHHTLAISNIGTATYNHFLNSVPGIGIRITNNAPATYLPDTNYITWTVTDTCGNRLTAVQKIYVHYPPCGGSVVATDYEATTYESVLIGAYCWTKSNLRSTKYSDGSEIPVALIYKSDLHEDTTANLTEYGRLYSWYSAVKIAENSSNLPDTNSNGNVPGVCPDGWYLPGETEYQDILSYGSDALRSSSGWLNGRNGSNTTGFNALPAGMYNGESNSFLYLLGNTYYWTSTYRVADAKCTAVDHNCPDILVTITSKYNGYSVRCVKENEIPQPAAIGDILCTDGTIVKPSAWPVSGKTAQGVVFYVDSTNLHGWAVALHDDGEMPWGGLGTNIATLTDYTTEETAKTDMDGYANTQKIRAAGTSVDYPTAWVVDLANGWYLPAEGQLFVLRQVKSSVNITLSQVSGDSFGAGSFWSSTEYSAVFTWGVLNEYPLNAYYKNSNFRVRSVRTF
jgi:uncharacterized protein (TIGR02145 family)